jgi:hypothetical protein
MMVPSKHIVTVPRLFAFRGEHINGSADERRG